MDNENIVNSIKALCKENNITVGQLEKKVGLSQGLVSKWKDKTPSLDKIIDIADYFRVSLDEVVGRNINNYSNQENDIIIPLIRMTDKKEIKWEYIFNYKNLKIHETPYEVFFDLNHGNEIEIYKCKYYNSYIFLIVQYDLEQGMVKNLDIELYLQPDDDSVPVLQEIDEEWIQSFWIGIRKNFKGIPDEWKAEAIRKQIINQSEKRTIKYMQQYIENIPDSSQDVDDLLADEKTKKIIAEVNSPEIQQLISMFTNPKMAQAMESAQKLVKYFGDIKKVKDDDK